MVGDEDQDEERNGKTDTKCKRSYRTVTLALVFHQKHEGRTKAGEYEYEGDGDQDFHDDAAKSRANRMSKVTL